MLTTRNRCVRRLYNSHLRIFEIDPPMYDEFLSHHFNEQHRQQANTIGHFPIQAHDPSTGHDYTFTVRVRAGREGEHMFRRKFVDKWSDFIQHAEAGVNDLIEFRWEDDLYRLLVTKWAPLEEVPKKRRTPRVKVTEEMPKTDEECKLVKRRRAAGPADPCGQSGTGIECSGSRVTHMIGCNEFETGDAYPPWSFSFDKGGYQSPGKYWESPQASTIIAPPMGLPRNLPAMGVSTNFEGPSRAKCYTFYELQLATNNFREENFIGKGSLGSVYKAEFPNGQIFVAKKLDMVSLSFQVEEQFLDILRCTSRLNHPSKAQCYKLFLLLSWDVRIKIAFGVAQALDYMHNLSTAHRILKVANIMVEEDLVPRVCDSALFILRPFTSYNTKVEASEMASNDCGYVAQEYGQTVYALGVLLLELLTGRKSFNSSRPTNEQSLVQCSTSRLHDCDSLEDMVDPFPPKALSQCADIMIACFQPEKEFRPQKLDIADILKKLLPKYGPECLDVDAFEKSFGQ